MRISNLLGDPKYSLWGTEEISYKDVKQGFLGDCWFMAAASSLAHVNPESIRNMFHI